MLFTIPVTMLRAANNSVTISIVELLALTKVSSDPKFSDKANWEKVTACWKSTTGGQREYISYDFAGSTDAKNFYVSDNSRIDFVLSYVAIMNIDKETLIVTRADIPSVGLYDFSFQVALPPENTVMLNKFLGTGTVKQSLTTVGQKTGQKVTLPFPSNLAAISFRLTKVGSPTGTIRAKIVEVSGKDYTWGGDYNSSPYPTLTSSNTINCADIGTDQEVKFLLPSPYATNWGRDYSSNIHIYNEYWIYIEVVSGTVNASNRIEMLGNNDLNIGIVPSGYGMGAHHMISDGSGVGTDDLDYKLYGEELALPDTSFLRDFASPASMQTANSHETGNAVFSGGALVFDSNVNATSNLNFAFNTGGANVTGRHKFSAYKTYKLRLYVDQRTDPGIFEGTNQITFGGAVTPITAGMLTAVVGSYLEVSGSGEALDNHAVNSITLTGGTATFSKYEIVEA